MHSLLGGVDLLLKLNQREVKVFDSIPESLLDSHYYLPLVTNYPAIDALTKEAALQSTVTAIHPIKGVQVFQKLKSLFPNSQIPIVFIVPESIADEFHKQPTLTAAGQPSKTNSPFHQFVVGLPLGIDTSPLKKRPRMS
jgi:hypothetical protein